MFEHHSAVTCMNRPPWWVYRVNKGYHTQHDVPRGGLHNPHDYVPIVMARLTLGMRYPEYYDDDVASAVCSAGSRCCMLCTVHHIATLKCTFGSALGRSTSNGTDSRLYMDTYLVVMSQVSCKQFRNRSLIRKTIRSPANPDKELPRLASGDGT